MSARTVKKRSLSDGQVCMCGVCGADPPLGRYAVLYHQTGSKPPTLAIGDPVRRLDEGDGRLWVDELGRMHADWVHRLPAERGPRTGTGLYSIRVEGKPYVRVVHRHCLRDELMRAEDAAVSADARNHDGEVVWFV